MRRFLVPALVLAALSSGVAGAALPPTNGVIAFVAADQATGKAGTIYTVSPDGKGKHKVGKGSDPAWFADGTRLVFRSSQAGVGGLFTTDPAGKDLKRVQCATCAAGSTPADPGYVDPAPSPDGDIVAVRDTDSVGIVDVSTGLDGDTSFDPELVLFDDCGAGCLSASSPAWSPDGKRVALVRGSGEGDGGVISGRVCIVAATGGAPKCITAGAGESDSVPDWSPDGKWIAFEHYFGCTAKGCRSGVYLVKPNGTQLHQVIADASQPVWSPDGTRLAFVRLAKPGTCPDPICRLGIATVGVDGKGLQTVTKGARDVFPSWQRQP